MKEKEIPIIDILGLDEEGVLAAVAKYRNIEFAQLLYFSDIVEQDAWSGFLEETPNIRKKISCLVLQIALNI